MMNGVANNAMGEPITQESKHLENADPLSLTSEENISNGISCDDLVSGEVNNEVEENALHSMNCDNPVSANDSEDVELKALNGSSFDSKISADVNDKDKENDVNEMSWDKSTISTDDNREDETFLFDLTNDDTVAVDVNIKVKEKVLHEPSCDSNTMTASDNEEGEETVSNGGSCDNDIISIDVVNVVTDNEQNDNSNQSLKNARQEHRPVGTLVTQLVSQCSDSDQDIDCIESNICKYNDSCQETVVMSMCDSDDMENEEMFIGPPDHSKLETFKICSIEKHISYHQMESQISCDSLRSEAVPKDDAVNGDSNNIIMSDLSSELNKDIIILNLEGSVKLDGNPKIGPEVHVIASDNESNECVIGKISKVSKNNITGECRKMSPKKNKIKTNTTSVELRRSSRTITRKRYIDEIQSVDDESDVEEVISEDPLKGRKITPIFISNSKSLVEQIASKYKTNKKKDNVIIIDSPIKGKPRPSVTKPTKPILNQNIYQTIMSRGTSVTPVSTKHVATQVTQETQTCALSILPTLTDDMFVVETPSFIVPYVYEKPSQVHFKQFVEKLGKEIEEEKSKEEQALLEKKKEEKAKRQQERQEKKDRGEDIQESEEEKAESKENNDMKKKANKKERRSRKKEDDDMSWDGSSSDESDDTITDDEAASPLKDQAECLDGIQDTKELTANTTGNSDSYFDSFLGMFFINIGTNLVQEYVQTDLLKQQQRKLQREKKVGHSTTNRALSIACLTKNLEMSQKHNESYKSEKKKCELCSFKTESAIVMGHHMELPHMKNNLYKCNFCAYEVRAPYDILHHMEQTHNVKGRLEKAPAQYQCPNCLFDVQGKRKLERHANGCLKSFKPDKNLAPAVELDFPAKITKLPKARSNVTPYQVSQFGRNHVDNNYGRLQIPIAISPPSPVHRPQNKPMQRFTGVPIQSRPSGISINHFPINVNVQTNMKGNNAKKTSGLSITPIPRAPPPTPVQNLNTANPKSFVICEICDGYIKDLEQLRNHMQWIHKVKIHPKMIYNKPPLNCQKCQFRFFTDQGLERHLLGSHGLVTSSMQDAANKGKDTGRCPVCGRVYQWKLLNHVSTEHHLMLKPAHLSYKCTVCTATFGMYKQFESHVYSAHSSVNKKATAKKPQANVNDIVAKQLKSNDEITVTIQPTTLSTQGKK